MRRLMVAQDTGGAIKGAQRADIFYGTGAQAGLTRGQVKDGGRMVLLLPIDRAYAMLPGRLTHAPPPHSAARGGRPLAGRRPHRARRCIRRQTPMHLHGAPTRPAQGLACRHGPWTQAAPHPACRGSAWAKRPSACRGHDLLPALSDRLAAAPLQMDAKTHRG